MKRFIVYYTRAGENYFDGAIKTIEKGNTEVIAEALQRLTGADLFRLEQKHPYSEKYQECVAQSREDLKQNARPELKAVPEGIAEYDLIYLGYPNYCGTMPMAVFTFLESIDTEGKVILPFCSNEGSGMGRSLDDLKACCPKAVIGKGLSVHGDCYEEEKLKAWARQI